MLELTTSIIHFVAVVLCISVSYRYLSKGQYQEAWWFMALLALSVMNDVLGQ